jgi:glycine hydroxymethyltransferase
MSYLLDLTEKEQNRQKNTLNLIASENYPSSKVLKLMGSVWSNKYGEGYPGKRYYAGNEFTDEMESFVQKKALEIFDKTDEYGVNVQVLSGSPANAMVFLSFLDYGDTILSMNLNNGGHLSHLHKTSNWLKFFKLINYDVKKIENEENYEIDVLDFENKLKEFRPKLTIIGASSYPKQINFQKLSAIAHNYGSLVLADVAHINGLIASDLHPSPFGYADFVTMTTHKTFRGPRAAMVFAKKEFMEILNKTVFPGTSGGPHFNKIAAIGMACQEILGEEKHNDNLDFKTYSKNILINCKTLENSLLNNGLQIVSATENHLCLIKLPENSDSLKIQKNLENVGIITNRNVIPFDTKSAWKPSGLRLGMAALTSRGITTSQTEFLANLIAEVIFEKRDLEEIKKDSLNLAKNLNWWYSD